MTSIQGIVTSFACKQEILSPMTWSLFGNVLYPGVRRHFDENGLNLI